MELIVGVCAAVVSISTAVFGYFKLLRDGKIEAVSSELSLWEARVELLEKERDALYEKYGRLKETITEIKFHLETCEREREKLFREKLELLQENRDLREANENRP